MPYTGEIRMIKWGVIPQEPSFTVQVGSFVGGGKSLEVVQIIEEVFDGGTYIYHVVCRKKTESGDGQRFTWSKYHKKPDFVQYFVPDKDHDYILP